MFEVLTLNKIASCGIDRLDKNIFNVTDDCANPDAIILRSFSMHDMELPENLKAVARAGAGVNNIPIDKCSEKGIVVFNTPGANANAVAEIAIAGLLLSSRKIVDGIAWANGLKGQEDVGKLVEKGKSAFAGPEIKGKKLGVIGLGAIGAMVANLAVALGMDVEGYDPYISVDAAWRLSRHIKKSNDLKMMVSRCDYITIHMPLTDSTKNIINDEMFDCMGDGTRLLNFARGGLVDNAALKRAIDSGKIACYITDFPCEETLGMENVINIPHLGASTPESEDNCAVMAADQMADFIKYGNIKNSVNFPACELPLDSKYRITIAHKNVPNMLSQFSAIFADENINIVNMLNKSKNDYAYTMVDVDSVPEDLAEKLNSLEDVCKVRIMELQ
ncbi:MAG: phosphoglycerate dehydrogenase [Clostridia bacterium]|nr:phosphoglycerate dehydrogenase [Clostridia bacterium]